MTSISNKTADTVAALDTRTLTGYTAAGQAEAAFGYGHAGSGGGVGYSRNSFSLKYVLFDSTLATNQAPSLSSIKEGTSFSTGWNGEVGKLKKDEGGGDSTSQNLLGKRETEITKNFSSL